MKLAIVYFTYLNDQSMLDISLQSLQRFKDFIDIFIIDDSKNPMINFNVNNYINNYHIEYSRSSFNRNGNLNGVECLDGMIEFYNKIMQKEYDWIIKTDADTIINDFNWLNNIDKKYRQAGTLNQQRYNYDKNQLICYGCFHCISKYGLQILNDEFNNNLDYYMKDIEAQRFAEDYMSCRLICQNNQDYNYYLRNRNNNPIYDTDTGVYFDFKANFYPKTIKNINLSLLRRYSAITFKKLSRVKNGILLNDIGRNYGYKRMKEYVERYCK